MGQSYDVPGYGADLYGDFTTLARARASLVTSTVAVVSRSGIPARQATGGEPS